MKHYVITILGLFFSLTSLWVGAFFMNSLTIHDWQHAPTFFTAFLFFVSGITLTIYGLVNINKPIVNRNIKHDHD